MFCGWKVIWDYFKDEKCVRGGEPVTLNHKLRFTLYILSRYMGKVRCLFIWKRVCKAT